MGQVEVTAVVATTHALTKYDGRFRLSIEDLEDLASRYRVGPVPMNFSHDPLRPGGSEVTAVNIEPTDDGESKLVIIFLVDENDWAAFESEMSEHGVANPAMSYSRTIPFEQVGVGQPALLISADAATYTQADIRAAAETLPEDIPALLAEYVEFSLADDVVNVIVILQQHPEFQQLEWSTFSALLYPTLLGLYRAHRRMRYRIQARRENGTQVDVVAEIDTKQQLEDLIEQVADLKERVSVLESELWEWRNGSWLKRLRNKPPRS